MDATCPGLPRRSRAKAPLLSIDPSGFRPSLISIEGADGFSLPYACEGNRTNQAAGINGVRPADS
jgi:hypothetical protein